MTLTLQAPIHRPVRHTGATRVPPPPMAADPVTTHPSEQPRDRSEGLLRRWIDDRDEGALASLIDDLQPMVASVCRRILGSSLDAEEVIHEAFADLAQDGAAIRGQPGAWLRRVATHRALRRMRSRRRQPGPLLGDETANPPTATGAETAADLVAAALDGLSEQDRDTLVRRFLLDQPVAEIAASTGRSASAVRKRIACVLGRLRYRPGLRLSLQTRI